MLDPGAPAAGQRPLPRRAGGGPEGGAGWDRPTMAAGGGGARRGAAHRTMVSSQAAQARHWPRCHSRYCGLQCAST